MENALERTQMGDRGNPIKCLHLPHQYFKKKKNDSSFILIFLSQNSLSLSRAKSSCSWGPNLSYCKRETFRFRIDFTEGAQRQARQGCGVAQPF